MLTYSSFELTAAILLACLAIPTIIVNGVCIKTIIKYRHVLAQPTSYFKLNLLVTCLLQGAFVFPFYAGKKMDDRDILHYHVFHDGFRFTYIITYYASVYAVLLIGADRLIAISFIFKYRTMVTNRRALSAILLSWIYITLLSILPFITNETIAKSSLQSNNSDISKMRCHHCHYHPTKVWTLFMLVANCWFPLILIVIFYKIIVYRLNKHLTKTIAKQIKNCFCPPQIARNHRDEHKRNQKITKMALMVSLIYVLLWSPSVIYYALENVCKRECFPIGYSRSDTRIYITFTIKYIAYCNAIVAPLVYCFYYKDFRKLLLSHTRPQMLSFSLSESTSTTTTTTTTGTTTTSQNSISCVSSTCETS